MPIWIIHLAAPLGLAAADAPPDGCRDERVRQQRSLASVPQQPRAAKQGPCLPQALPHAGGSGDAVVVPTVLHSIGAGRRALLKPSTELVLRPVRLKV